jgi:hypothetical protein
MNGDRVMDYTAEDFGGMADIVEKLVVIMTTQTQIIREQAAIIKKISTDPQPGAVYDAKDTTTRAGSVGGGR